MTNQDLQNLSPEEVQNIIELSSVLNQQQLEFEAFREDLVMALKTQIFKHRPKIVDMEPEGFLELSLVAENYGTLAAKVAWGNLFRNCPDREYERELLEKYQETEKKL